MAVLKTLFFTLFVPGFFAVYLPYALLRSRLAADFFDAGPVHLFGYVLLALGALGYFWCAKEFALTGRGTPAPVDPPRELVARGPYRFVRNPMYVSVGLVLLGEGLAFESWKLLLYAAGAFLIFHLFVVYYEEPALRRKFGESYAAYCKSVPRWTPWIPRRKETD